MTDETCIFCKIIKGELPSAKIYEDNTSIAFLDIAPVNPGHTLVVSKEHYENLYDAPEEILQEMIKVIKKIAIAVKESVNADGINIIQSNESAAGQVIKHIHFHIIPRRSDDGLKHWPQGKYKSDEEMKETAEKIKEKLKL